VEVKHGSAAQTPCSDGFEGDRKDVDEETRDSKVVTAGAVCRDYAMSRSVGEFFEGALDGGSANGFRRVEEWGDEIEGGVDKGLPQPDTTRWERNKD
jgi:hypothetical protein